MSVVAYDLGSPLAAALRGGDCRARDLTQGRNVYGGHRFAATSHCRISNGLLRVTVGASGAAPALTIAAYRGPVTIGDPISDVISDALVGSDATPAWQSMGTLTIDSPTVTALLTAVVIHDRTPESITLRLVVPVTADAYITLRRGERMLRIQHGSTRPPLVDTDRRIRWTDTVNPVGTAYAFSRIQEDVPAIEGFPRVIGCRSVVIADAGLFKLTAASTPSATFLAGVATYEAKDQPADYLGQLSTEFRLPPAIQIEAA